MSDYTALREALNYVLADFENHGDGTLTLKLDLEDYQRLNRLASADRAAAAPAPEDAWLPDLYARMTVAAEQWRERAERAEAALRARPVLSDEVLREMAREYAKGYDSSIEPIDDVLLAFARAVLARQAGG